MSVRTTFFCVHS